MKYLLLLCVCAICITFNVSAQQTAGTTGPVLLHIPKTIVPEGGFSVGGVVQVRVSINETGDVTDAVFFSGPGSICDLVTRPDVVLTRHAAVDLARKAKFTPATTGGNPVASTAKLSIEYPAQKPSGQSPPEMVLTALGESEAPRGGHVISGGVLNGKALALPKPSFPAAARAVHAEGAVQVQVLIDEDGNIFSAAAVSGHPLLQNASVQAACGSKFSPTLLQGQPVKVSGIITYNFVP